MSKLKISGEQIFARSSRDVVIAWFYFPAIRHLPPEATFMEDIFMHFFGN